MAFRDLAGQQPGAASLSSCPLFVAATCNRGYLYQAGCIGRSCGAGICAGFRSSFWSL